MDQVRPHTASPCGAELGPSRGEIPTKLHTNPLQTLGQYLGAVRLDVLSHNSNVELQSEYSVNVITADNSVFHLTVAPVRIGLPPTDDATPTAEPTILRAKSVDRPPLLQLESDFNGRLNPRQLLNQPFEEFEKLKKRGRWVQPPSGVRAQVGKVDLSGGGTSRKDFGWERSRPPSRAARHAGSTQNDRVHANFGPPRKRQRTSGSHQDNMLDQQPSGRVLQPITNQTSNIHLLSTSALDYSDSDEEEAAGLTREDQIQRKAARRAVELAGRYHPDPPEPGQSPHTEGSRTGHRHEIQFTSRLRMAGLGGVAEWAGDDGDEEDEEGGEAEMSRMRETVIDHLPAPQRPTKRANGYPPLPAAARQAVLQSLAHEPEPTPPPEPNPTVIFNRPEFQPAIIKPQPVRAFDLDRQSQPAPANPAVAPSRVLAPRPTKQSSLPVRPLGKGSQVTHRQNVAVTNPELPAQRRLNGPPAVPVQLVQPASIEPVVQQSTSSIDPSRLPPLPPTGSIRLSDVDKTLLRLPPLPSLPPARKRAPVSHPSVLPKPVTINKSKWVRPLQLEMINGKPPIWSYFRQEVCESVEYYKSYQGGHYVHNNFTRGYLLDGFPSMRDAVSAGGRIIISHGGGKSEQTEQGFQLKESQTANGYRVKDLLNCMTAGYPVVMVAGENCGAFPRLRELGVKYAVLGFYKVTAAWTELEPNLRPGHEGEGFVRWKFRFEWLKSQGRPWFADLIGTWPAEGVDFLDKDPPFVSAGGGSARCERCSFKADLDPFCEEISCFSPACENYFLIDGKQANLNQLHFRRSFLEVGNQFDTTNATVPYQLVPESLQESSRTGTSFSSWSGFWCSSCGRLSCRKCWDKLECSYCHQVVGAMPSVQRPPQATSLSLRQPHRLHPSSRITPLQITSGEFQGWTYDLPNNTGKIHHFWSLDLGRIRQVNDLFHQFQQNDVGALLRRNPLSKHKGGGGVEFLTRQFGFNAGERYRYVVAVGQHPFKLRPGEVRRLGGEGEDQAAEAPECVRTTLDLAVEFAKKRVARPALADDLNEVLTVGYFENQRMSFHHDGEAGLGEIVSTLSLGSPASMQFRQRVPKGELKSQGKKSVPTALTITLEHGDWIIMEGREVQAKWEHAVAIIDKPASGLKGDQVVRFAATSRCIGNMHEQLMTPKSSRNNSGRTTPVGSSGGLTPTGAMTPVRRQTADAKKEAEAQDGGAEREEYDEYDDEFGGLDLSGLDEEWWDGLRGEATKDRGLKSA